VPKTVDAHIASIFSKFEFLPAPARSSSAPELGDVMVDASI